MSLSLAFYLAILKITSATADVINLLTVIQDLYFDVRLFNIMVNSKELSQTF